MPESISPARRRSPPSGGAFGTITASDGSNLRVASWAAATPKATFIFVHGRREFIEKHYETIADLLDRDYSVVTMDWLGQGLSGRPLADRQKGHVDSFDSYVSDLDLLVSWVKRRFAGPYMVLGHSMGGHCALRYLSTGGSDIAAGVLVAPMTAISFGPLPEVIARGIVNLACSLGMQSAYAPAQGPYKEAERRSEAYLLTNDLDRLEDEIIACEKSPELALGGVTYGWLRAAFMSIDKLRSHGTAEAITTPLLAVLGTDDRVVRNKETAQFFSRLSHGRIVKIPNARHEILKERDDLGAWFWAAFDAFMAKNLAG